MPVGDNQYSFTCGKCGRRLDRIEKCPRAGSCRDCCDLSDSDHCRTVCHGCAKPLSCHPSHTHAAELRCTVCGNHSGCGSIYGCLCATCLSCKEIRLGGEMYTANHPCRKCHAVSPDLAGCLHCDYLKCVSPERGRCCGRCPIHCRATGCKFKGPVEWLDMPILEDCTPRKVLSRRGQFQFNPSKRTIGLEIECSNYKYGSDISKAVKQVGGALVSDGSVSQGFEINTAPMNGDVFVHAVQLLANAMESAETVSDVKASIHVHIGCNDMSEWDLMKVIMLYGRLESGLYSVIDPRRLIGRYSVPNGGRDLVRLLEDSTDPRKDIFEMAYGQTPSRETANYGKNNRAPNGSSRYLGMNLHSWYHRGTIEFRAHHGTRQWSKMVGWAMLLCSIVDTANASSIKTVVNWPQGLEGLKKVSPTPWVKQWVVDRWTKFSKMRQVKTDPIADF